MFSFSKSRNKQSEAQQFLARLADRESMDRLRMLEEHRDEKRTSLNVGVWIIPMDGADLVIEKIFVALAMESSSKGLAVITNRSVSASEVLVCFSGQYGAKFLRADVRNCKRMGLGWFRLGMEVTEIVEKEEHPQLNEFEGLMVS